jgi:hypothetical protein
MAAVRHAFVTQRHALVYAEAMLFIDNDQCEAVEVDAFLE